MRFITESHGCRYPTMKIGMHIILCVHAVWLRMHPFLKGNLREAWARVLSLLVLLGFPIYLHCLHVSYHALTFALHLHNTTV